MQTLEKRFLSNSNAERLYKNYQNLGKNPEDYCPTCLRKGFYFWPTIDDKVICDCNKQLQLHKHYLNAGIGVLYQRLDFDDLEANEDITNLIDQYLGQSSQMVARGIGIVLSGSIGSGKTLVATLILKHLLHLGHSVFASTFAEMVDLFTAGWYSVEEKEFFHQRVRKSEIVLIDDIGKEFRSKNALSEITFDGIIRGRVQDGLPTFITTNMTMDDMQEGYGASVFSLLLETSIIEKLNTTDYRHKAGQKKLQELMSGLTRPIV